MARVSTSASDEPPAAGALVEAPARPAASPAAAAAAEGLAGALGVAGMSRAPSVLGAGVAGGKKPEGIGAEPALRGGQSFSAFNHTHR